MGTNSSDGVSTFAGKKIWITGHRGMLGSAMVRSLENEGAQILLTSRTDLDLTNASAVLDWMQKNRPELVFHIAAKVGGIHANATLPADFLHDNLAIQSSVIDGAYKSGVQKLIFVASNCTYPTNTKQPIPESALFTGLLDDNIRAYAVSKIAGIEMCRAYKKQYGSNFISIIPPNLYGPGDNYHPQNSHVVAGILSRAHEAKMAGKAEIVVWGDGSPRRELLYIDDLAAAMKYVMYAQNKHDLYNIGSGSDRAISEIASIIAKVVGFNGRIIYDTAKPNGTMRKLLDTSLIRSLGWQPLVGEEEGLSLAYQDFLERLNVAKVPV